MLSSGGSLLWSSDHDTWGSLRTLRAAFVSGDYWTEGVTETPADTAGVTFCPIRFQSQWEDAETGLYQNRFRYYDPGAGQYLSADPNRLYGGGLGHSYTQIPSWLVDPFGLVPCRCCHLGSFSGEVGNSLFTPDNPADFGLQPGDTIPFNNGVPDFGQYTRSVHSLPGQFEVPGLTGNHQTDRALILRHMSAQSGIPQSQIARTLSGAGENLRLHHSGGNTVQVVPAQTHSLPHYGAASELRDRC